MKWLSEYEPKSAVEGDPIPQVLNGTVDLLAIPATRAMNIALSEFTWPEQWKMETQTAIPKTSTPRDTFSVTIYQSIKI